MMSTCLLVILHFLYIFMLIILFQRLTALKRTCNLGIVSWRFFPLDDVCLLLFNVEPGLISLA